MNIIDALSHGIETTIKNSKEFLQNKDFDKVIRMFDKFITSVSSKNSSRLVNYNLFEFFSMFVIARNYDNDNFQIENITLELEKYRGTINSWSNNKLYFLNLSKIVERLEENHDFIKDPKYQEMLSSIGFDPSISKYHMISALKATDLLIQFQILYKDKENDFQSKVLSQQLLERMSYVSVFCRNYRDEVSNDKKEYMEFYQKRIKYTKELKNCLENHTITEMTNISDEWYDYLHPTVLSLVYPIVNMNLENYYNYINEAIETVENAINISPLVNYMYSEHIDAELIPKEILDDLNDTDLEVIKTNFTLLTYLGINPYEVFIKYSELLKSINNENALKLTYLAEKNILNKNTVSKNPGILLDNIDTITTNYELLKEQVDFNNINYNGDILFLDSNEIKRRLNILSFYKLYNSNYIFLLCNFEYLGIYDLIIENEIPEHLFIPICYTNNPLETIKRIKLYQELSIPYLSPTNTLINEVTTSSKALCSNEELNEFYPDTINSNIYKNINGRSITDIVDDDFINTLDKEYRIENVYLITSKPLSRPKVLRNIQFIKDNNLELKEYLLPALISNSIINPSEIDELKHKTQEKSYILL